MIYSRTLIVMVSWLIRLRMVNLKVILLHAYDIEAYESYTTSKNPI